MFGIPGYVAAGRGYHRRAGPGPAVTDLRAPRARGLRFGPPVVMLWATWVPWPAWPVPRISAGEFCDR
jgi:hypothetical protein